MPRAGPEPYARVDVTLAAVCALVPALFAALHADGAVDAAHAGGAVRALGLGWTGALRSLDPVLASVFELAPIGTRAYRASLGSALAAGLATALVFALARRMLGGLAPEWPKLARTIAAIAALTGGLSSSVQLEATAVAGTSLALALGIAPLAAVALGAGPHVLGLALGLATAQEPLALAIGAAGVLAWTLLQGRPARPSSRTVALFSIAFAAGLAPLACVLLARDVAPSTSTTHAMLGAPLGEGAGPVALGAWASDAVGVPSLVLAGIGAVAALRTRASRAIGAGLLAMAAVGALGLAAGAPGGGARASVAALAVVCASAALAGAGMIGVALAVARVPVPFAHASAVMVVLLECVFPLRSADEAALALEGRKPLATRAWTREAFVTLEPGALVLVSDARVLDLALAGRATGDLPADLTLLPMSDPAGPLATSIALADPLLASLVRDARLSGAPEELSLARVSSARPTYLTFDAKWDRVLARHLVPAVAFDRFHPEPRGASDRRKAREELGATRERWIALALHPRDEALARATGALLRGRVVASAAANDKDAVAAALGELQRVSPGDPVGAEIARRVVLGKGPLRVDDLPVPPP